MHGDIILRWASSESELIGRDSGAHACGSTDQDSLGSVYFDILETGSHGRAPCVGFAARIASSGNVLIGWFTPWS